MQCLQKLILTDLHMNSWITIYNELSPLLPLEFTLTIRQICPSEYLLPMLGTLFWTFGERHNWSFYVQSTTNIQQNILHPTGDSSNSKRNLHALISALIFDATPLLSSRKQDFGGGSIIQSLFLPSILCHHHAVHLALRFLEIILSPVRYWNPRLGRGLQCS